MPRRRNNNKRKKNRRRRGRKTDIFTRVYGPRRTGIAAAQSPWIKLSMKYSDTFDVTLLTTGVSDQVYRANSLFDPDRTNTGHQPMSFDQYFPIYNRYHVYGFSWRIHCSSAADPYHMACGIVNGAEVFTSATDFRTFREGPRVIDRTASFGGPAITLSGHHKLNTFNGVSMQAYLTDDRFGSIVTTNPTEIIDFHIMHYNPSANTILLHYTIDIVYHCIMHDPIIADPSLVRERMIMSLTRNLQESGNPDPLIMRDLRVLTLEERSRLPKNKVTTKT